MLLRYSTAALVLCMAGTAVARGTIRVNECIVTIGKFCPLESIGATLAGGLVIGLVVFGVRWLFTAATRALPKPPPLTQVIQSDSHFAGDIQRSEQITSWCEAFEKLPVDKYLVVNGFNVWKLKYADGRVYFSGDRSCTSIDELLDGYKIR